VKLLAPLRVCAAPIVFDPEGTGRVVPNELLMAFSMSMKGTGEARFTQLHV
jgi:hypothetical protein